MCRWFTFLFFGVCSHATKNVRPPPRTTVTITTLSSTMGTRSLAHCPQLDPVHQQLAATAELLEFETLHARRGMLFAQILAPPLPMVCVSANRQEGFSSSHDLLSSIFGRLLSLPEQGKTLLRGAYPDQVCVRVFNKLKTW